ncbi:MAG TPA: pectinesterase family protein [Chryseolinea sp.]|nr:pectinesterase family protein [Chryseolinea sp.]HPM31174.1 pectinesterase family protein [Chryseolinea sp.]
MGRLKILLFFFCTICIQCSTDAQPDYKTSYTVSQDGKGDFKTLQETLNACKAFPDVRITIRIRPGTYIEKIEVHSWNTRIELIGEDPTNTIIKFDDYSGKGDINTFTSYTVKVLGNDFYAENITFENAAGPVGQAVALHVEADRCVFKNCRFLGNQDTIYTGGETSRQYFSNCYIEGTTDFIFGAATAVFENCTILSKKNSYVTAASTTQGKLFGYVFLNCTLKATSEATKVYLGRPWRIYAKTVFVNCNLGSHILPEGWHNWSKPEAEKTVYYGEYNSKGTGANPSARVSWSHQLNSEESLAYTVDKILQGNDQWKPNGK